MRKEVCAVINKGGTVLLTLTKGKIWRCPSFEFDTEPLKVLERGLKEKLNIKIKSNSFVHKHKNGKSEKLFLHIKGFEGMLKPSEDVKEIRWFDTQDLDRIDVSPDSKFAIIKSEIKMGYWV